MTHSNQNLTKALIFATTACAFAFGAANSYAIDNGAVNDAEAVQGQIWVHEKTAVTENAAYIDMSEPLPDVVAPMNVDFKVDVGSNAITKESETYSDDADLREFDLVEDSPIFIGAKAKSEFDTRDALSDRGFYPKSMEVDPLYTVAGAGVSTSF